MVTSKLLVAGGKVISSIGTVPGRYVYYPGIEELKKGEISLVVCGTGLPAVSWPKSEMATILLRYRNRFYGQSRSPDDSIRFS